MISDYPTFLFWDTVQLFNAPPQHQTECHDPIAALRKDRGEKIVCAPNLHLKRPKHLYALPHSLLVTSPLVPVSSLPPRPGVCTSSTPTPIQKNTFLQSLIKVSVVCWRNGEMELVCWGRSGKIGVGRMKGKRVWMMNLWISGKENHLIREAPKRMLNLLLTRTMIWTDLRVDWIRFHSYHPLFDLEGEERVEGSVVTLPRPPHHRPDQHQQQRFRRARNNLWRRRRTHLEEIITHEREVAVVEIISRLPRPHIHIRLRTRWYQRKCSQLGELPSEGLSMFLAGVPQLDELCLEEGEGGLVRNWPTGPALLQWLFYRRGTGFSSRCNPISVLDYVVEKWVWWWCWESIVHVLLSDNMTRRDGSKYYLIKIPEGAMSQRNTQL